MNEVIQLTPTTSIELGAAQAAQGSAEWRAVRCGRVTASRVGDVIARTKTGWAASRAAYLGQLLAERLTGSPVSVPSTPAMRWGVESEPLAKAAYCFLSDREIAPAGFVQHPNILMSGASPDGLLEAGGLIEIKCPTTVVHLETVAAGTVPAKHLPQIQWQLACTERDWCEFISFDPRLPEGLKLFASRVDRDDALIRDLEQHVHDFLDELDRKQDALIRGLARREAA